MLRVKSLPWNLSFKPKVHYASWSEAVEKQKQREIELEKLKAAERGKEMDREAETERLRLEADRSRTGSLVSGTSSRFFGSKTCLGPASILQGSERPVELCACRADIVIRVTGGETPPFRPPIPSGDDTGVNPQLLQLMRDCWDEHPALRPDFSTVCSRFLQINGEKYELYSQFTPPDPTRL